jgi:hypothetical protein
MDAALKTFGNCRPRWPCHTASFPLGIVTAKMYRRANVCHVPEFSLRAILKEKCIVFFVPECVDQLYLRRKVERIT